MYKALFYIFFLSLFITSSETNLYDSQAGDRCYEIATNLVGKGNLRGWREHRYWSDYHNEYKYSCRFGFVANGVDPPYDGFVLMRKTW